MRVNMSAIAQNLSLLIVLSTISLFSLYWPKESEYPVLSTFKLATLAIDRCTGQCLNRTDTSQKKTMAVDRLSIDNHGPDIIVVVAYYRSGSTLTGYLLQEHPGTFYAFEPIRMIHEAFAHNPSSTTLDYFSGKMKYASSDSRKVIQEEIKAWLTCDLNALSIQTLTDTFIKVHSKALRSFANCSGLWYHSYQKYATFRNEQVQKIKQCLQSDISVCKSSSRVVLKLIRQEVADIEKLLQDFPNMKIIHLIRDPRGMLVSRSRIHKKFSMTDTYVNSLCGLIERNLNSTTAILKSAPSRVMLLRYEDLAEFPLSYAEEIYKFAGFPFDNRIEAFMKLNTAGGESGSKWDVQRSDSSKTASAWRDLINFELANSVYEKCSWSMKILGYLPFESRGDMTNLTIKSRVPVNSTDILLAVDKP